VTTVQTTLGQKLRYLREQHKLSVRELGRRSQISASYLSEVERDRVEPSISKLKQIAKVYGISLTHFFTTDSYSDTHVVRHDSRAEWTHSAGGAPIFFQLLSPRGDAAIEALLLRYEPGATDVPSTEEPFSHEGEEWGLVLSGRLKIVVGEDVIFLDEGDAIWYPSSLAHRVENISDKLAICIWVVVPPTF
jgi:transcriptional regulator with XRE-family HTH domain